MQIISVIGYSGSGKTNFILNAINLLKTKLKKEVSVIKYIHEHKVETKGKDSYKYSKVGAKYSVLKNINNEITIFLKNDANVNEIANWLTKGPYRTNFLFTEGFRNLKYPTVLCIRDLDDIKQQLNDDVKLISGIYCERKQKEESYSNIPILAIKKNFHRFLEIFNIH